VVVAPKVKGQLPVARSTEVYFQFGVRTIPVDPEPCLSDYVTAFSQLHDIPLSYLDFEDVAIKDVTHLNDGINDRKFCPFGFECRAGFLIPIESFFCESQFVT